MPKKPPKFKRDGSTIFAPTGTTECPSINEAKRQSRALQKKTDGALGRGCLVNVTGKRA